MMGVTIALLKEKGGTVGGGLVHPKGENSMAMSGLAHNNPLVGVGESFHLF